MANIGQFQTPTGQTGNILSVKSWISGILGAIFLLATFSIGQKLGKAVENRVPQFDTTPQQPWETPRVVSSGPRETVI